MLLTILVFIVMLSVLVLVHELGHFLVAKKFGIKVEEFGFGFPPRLLGKKIGETLYSINALPIGGFVKLYGEDEAGSGRIGRSTKVTDVKRAFFSRSIKQRSAVVVAGVIMNFLLAVILSTYLFTFQGVPVNTNQVLVTQVLSGSPAATAGIKNGDLILKVGGVTVGSTNNLVSETKKHLGQKTTLTLVRDGKIQNVEVTPRSNYPKNQGPMGVAIEEKINFKKYPFPVSILYALKQSASDSVQVVLGFVNVVTDISTKLTIPQGVAGPIGMAQLTGEFVKIGPTAVISLIYMLSLSLGVLNILPIPALDGGRLLFIVIEGITRKKVNPKIESYAHMVGIVVLLGFLAVVSYQDLLRLISGKSIFPQ